MKGFSEIKSPDIEAAKDRASEIAEDAREVASKAWDELAAKDVVSDTAEKAQDLADQAWEAARPAVESGSAGLERGAKDTAYLGGRAGIGVAKVGENAVKAVGTIGSEIRGDSASSVDIARSSELDTLADNLGDSLEVDERVESMGDAAELAGNVAAGYALSTAAPPLGNALFALDAAGEVLEAEAQDGELNAWDYVFAASAAAVTAAAPTIINRAAGEVAEAAGPAVERASQKASRLVKEVHASSLEQIERVKASTFSKLTRKPIERFPCKNESLAGGLHPKTGVEFRRRYIVQDSGRIIEGVFPKFDSLFSAKLPKSLFESSNVTQFKEANRQLLKGIESDEKLAGKFTAEQIEQIKDGILDGSAPDGFVWNHNEEEGILQLVDRATHEMTAHTGGRSIWGGGY